MPTDKDFMTDEVVDLLREMLGALKEQASISRTYATLSVHIFRKILEKDPGLRKKIISELKENNFETLNTAAQENFIAALEVD